MNKYGVRECQNIKSFFLAKKSPHSRQNADDRSMDEETKKKSNYSSKINFLHAFFFNSSVTTLSGVSSSTTLDKTGFVKFLFFFVLPRSYQLIFKLLLQETFVGI